MPGTYRFDGDLLRLRFERRTSLAEVEETLEAALEDPACPACPKILSDLRQSESLVDRPSDEMRTAVAVFGRRASRVHRKCAVLTAGPAQYGMMRMAKAYAEGYELDLHIFGDEAEAVEWLGQE